MSNKQRKCGQKKSSKIGNGNKWLKSLLVECAWTAVRKKDHYLRSKYYKLVTRMGKKKALIVVAHKMLKSCYYVLEKKESYKDLGASYLEKDNKDKLLKHYTKKISAMGFNVQIDPINLAQT